VPALDFPVRLRRVGRSSDARHALAANELLEIACDALRPVVGDDPPLRCGVFLLARSRIPKPGNYNHLKTKKRAWQFRLKNPHSCHPLFLSSLLLGRRRGIRASNLSNLALMSRTRHTNPIGIAATGKTCRTRRGLFKAARHPSAMATIKLVIQRFELATLSVSSFDRIGELHR
jgi:hypothetical protein